MSQPQLSLKDLKRIASQAGSSNPVVSLWTAETTSLDLFQKNQKDDGKMASLQEFSHKQKDLLQESFLLAIEKACECVWESGEAQTVLGEQFASEANLQDDFYFTWKSSTAGITGYYAIEKAFFFKIFDLLFGGKRLHIPAGDLTPFDLEVLLRILNPIHNNFQEAFEKIGLLSTELGIQISDSEKLKRDCANTSLIKTKYLIKEGDQVLGTFRNFVPQEVLRYFTETSVQPVAEAVNHDLSFQNAVRACIGDVKIGVKVTLGMALASLRSIVNVKSEDEWMLILPEAGHAVEVQGRDFGLASIGEAGGQRAVQMIEVIKGE